MSQRIGLKNGCLFPLIKDNSAEMTEDGLAVVQYGAKIKLPNLQKLDIKYNVQSASSDSDDYTTNINICTGCEGSITRNSMTPEECAVMLGEKTINGFNISGKNDAPPEFAFGFTMPIYGGEFAHQLILRTKFSYADVSAESGSDDKITLQPDSINYKSSTRRADGAWRFHKRTKDPEDAKKFFTVETVQTLANAVNQTHCRPADVVFADTKPNTGEAGKVYIVSNKAYYWNGSEMVEITQNA